MTTEGKINKDSVVGDVLDKYPQALEVFLRHGFTPLANAQARQALAGTVTVEQAIKIHPADLVQLLEDLNQVAAQG